MEYGTYLIGKYQVNGALAEICSTLFQDADFVGQVLGAVSVDKIAQAFDTRHPAEERVKVADEVISQVTLNSRLGRWFPMHHLLNKLEYSSAFYPGYRDHSVHSLQVFLLGWYLYLNCVAIRQPLAHSLRLRATDAGSLSDFELFHEWWTVAALWHDLGYPFEATSFISDVAFRDKLLQELSQEFGAQPFRAALTSLKRDISAAELRELYRHGKYYPWELKNTDSLFTGNIKTPINEMWKRLGASASDPTAAVITLTTQTPPGRLSYWDHGLMSGLVLSAWWNEVEQFAVSFAAPSTEIDKIVPSKERESAALDVMSLTGPATCAVEAIAFHNIALHQWSANDLRPLFGAVSSYSSPGLNNESHLFFLALCDTLQDWDRHHFSPSTVATYRPAVPSSSMLLQAKEDSIAIALGSPDPVATVKKLFKDWLDNSDIDRLFTDSPQYTYPALVNQLDPQTTVAHVSVSKQTFNRMTQAVIQLTSQIREMLITDPNSAVLKIGSAADDGLAELKRLETRLLPSHWSDFYSGDVWRQLITVQSMASMAVGVNTEVTRGTISSKLGDGGFGVVYAVVPPDTSVSVRGSFAYKVYHSADLFNSSKRELFRRGFDAMRRLKDNPGIVDVYEFTEFPVGFYMRLVNGPDMLQNLSVLSDIHQRLSTLEQIGRILVYAHKHNVHHRDIKPANVILDSDQDYRPVLTDFDLAWISGRSTVTGAAYASMLYGAPEQFEDRLGPLRSRPTVDVFSFGKLMYYVLTDQEPPPLASFNESHWDFLRMRLSGQVFGIAVSNLVEIIQQCTEWTPDKRLPTMNAVVERISAVREIGYDELRPLSPEDFVHEVFAQYRGKPSGNGILSVTGASLWGIQVLEREGPLISVDLEIELQRDVNKEGITVDDFRRQVIRGIDRAVEKARQNNPRGSTAWVKNLSRRGGLSSHKWTINATRFVPNYRNALRIAHLMTEVASVIE